MVRNTTVASTTVLLRGGTDATSHARSVLNEHSAFAIHEESGDPRGGHRPTGVDCVVVDPTGDDQPVKTSLEQIQTAISGVPVLVYTADGSEQLASAALRAGATDYITRTGESDLAARIESACVPCSAQPVSIASTPEFEYGDRLRALFDESPNAVLAHDIDGTILAVNDRGIELLGYDRETLLGMNVADVETRVDLGALRNRLRDMTVGERIQIEGVHDPADDNEYPAEIWIHKTRFDDETTFIAIWDDAVERREQQRKLERQSFLFDRVQELAGVGVWEYDPQAEETTWSDGMRRIFGVADGYDPTLENALELFHPSDRTELSTVVAEALESGDISSHEFRIVRPDGDIRYVRGQGEVYTDENGDIGVARGVLQDVTEQKDRERKLDSLVANTGHAIYIKDENGRFQLMNEAGADLFDLDAESVIGLDEATLFDPETAAAIRETDERIIETGQAVTDEYATFIDGEKHVFLTNKYPYRDEEGTILGVMGISREITERKRREQAMAELHDASREMVVAPSRDEVEKRFLDAADTILDVDAAGIYDFDDEQNVLEPTGTVTNASANLTLPAIEPGTSLVWRAFVNGETEVIDRISDEPIVSEQDPYASMVALPLATHGLFVCVSRKTGAFDEQRVELIETLAANAEAVLERTERERDLKQTERQLQQYADRLEQLNTVNEQICQTTRQLAGTTTREALEETICEGLAEIDSYEFAWIGRRDGSVITPLTTAGSGETYLTQIQPLELTTDQYGEPSGRAAATGERTVVETVAGQLRKADWQQTALMQNFLSVLSVPIEHQGVRYGILTVYANETEAFGRDTRRLLGELADAAGEVCHRVAQRQALGHDETIEVTLRTRESSQPLVSIATRLETALSVERVRVESSGSTAAFVELAQPTDVAIDSLDAVESARIASSTADSSRCELRVAENTLAKTVIEHGGSLERIVPEGQTIRVVVTFPDVDSLSGTLTAITDRHPSLTITRQRRPSLETDSCLEEQLFDEMTDRQHEALELAYRRGYFEVPRRTSGTALAESMGLSPPTYLEHLRRAKATILTTLLENRGRE